MFRAIIVSLGRGWRQPLSSARSSPGGDRVFLDVSVTDESPGKIVEGRFQRFEPPGCQVKLFRGCVGGVDLILPVSRHGTTFRYFEGCCLLQNWKNCFQKRDYYFVIHIRDRCDFSRVDIENNVSILVGIYSRVFDSRVYLSYDSYGQFLRYF